MNTPSDAMTILWFRDDLRLGDNPALQAAVDSGHPVLCLYILDEGSDRRPLGGAARWWLAQSLRALGKDIAAIGGRLVLLRGDPATIMPALAHDLSPRAVYWNRRYGAAEVALDSRIKERLTAAGIKAASFNGALLNEPWDVTTQTGSPMKVFSPYWRAARFRGEPAPPLPAPKSLVSAPVPTTLADRALSVDDLGLEPRAPDWSIGLKKAWSPGEAGAKVNLLHFLAYGLKGYGEDRNRPDLDTTSRLSPHLRFGEISVRQIWHVAHAAFQNDETDAPKSDLDKFTSELGWREFSNHLLFYNPDLASKNYNARFDAFPWTDDASRLRAWQLGQTGYPIVDAGMRELWQTGWMHNRVRMITASFLVKHLLIDWREGERWFWDTLVDADPANNAASWQWVAGSGADAAPYFRIFNPMTQSEKFDPKGEYLRRWLPELKQVPDRYIAQPWTAPAAVLATAGVKLGNNYPKPVIDHDAGRQRALAAFAALKTETG